MKWIEQENFWVDDVFEPYKKEFIDLEGEVKSTNMKQWIDTPPSSRKSSLPTELPPVPEIHDPDLFDIVLDETEEGALWKPTVLGKNIGDILLDDDWLLDNKSKTFYKVNDTLDRWREVNKESKLYHDLNKKYKGEIERWEQARKMR